MNGVVPINLSATTKCGTESNLSSSQSQKKSKYSLVMETPNTFFHITSFLDKQSIGRMRRANNALRNSLKIKDIKNVIVPKTDIYKTAQIEKVKQMHDDFLGTLFRMHPLEEIRDTVLCLCSEPLSDHAHTYLAQVHAYLIKETRSSFFRYYFSRKQYNAFILIANHSNHNSTGRQYLAQSFAYLTEEGCNNRCFYSNNELKKLFFSVANHTDNNSIGRQYLAQTFVHLMWNLDIISPVIDLKNKEFIESFISVANHTDHNSTGRQYLAEVFANLINSSNGLSFFIKDESFQNSFISLVNHYGHNSTGRQYLAHAFLLLTIDSDAITFFCESESFQKSCIFLVKQNGHTPAGLKYLSNVGHFLKNNSSRIPFWVIESFLDALDTADIVHQNEPLKNKPKGVSFWLEEVQSFLNT